MADRVAQSATGAVADRVYEQLRREILDLSLRPGERVTENTLAARLNASRTPVRQALHRLREDRLLEAASGGGLQIAQLSPRDVGQLCDLLAVVDSYLFSRAAERGREGDAGQQLVELAKQLVKAAKTHDLDAWRQLDSAYHAVIHDLADNPWASDVSNETRARLHRFWVPSSDRQKRLAKCSTEHTEMAKAIAAGDPDAAVGVVGEHVAHMRSSLLAVFEAASPLLGSW